MQGESGVTGFSRRRVRWLDRVKRWKGWWGPLDMCVVEVMRR